MFWTYRGSRPLPTTLNPRVSTYFSRVLSPLLSPSGLVTSPGHRRKMSCSVPRLLPVSTSRDQRTSTSTGPRDGVTVARMVRGPTAKLIGHGGNEDLRGSGNGKNEKRERGERKDAARQSHRQ